MLLITHADRQNANICFSAKSTISSSEKKMLKKKNLYGLMYNWDIFWQETTTNLSVLQSSKQILAQ